MKAKLNIANLKAWGIKHRPLAKALCEAMAYAQVMRQEVDAIQRKVLYKIPLFNDLESGHKAIERIFDSRLTYLSEDEKGFKLYLDECDRLEREAGLKPADMKRDFCPALVAEHNQVKLEWVLLDSASGLMGIDALNVHGDKRKELLGLLLSVALKK